MMMIDTKKHVLDLDTSRKHLQALVLYSETSAHDQAQLMDKMTELLTISHMTDTYFAMLPEIVVGGDAYQRVSQWCEKLDAYTSALEADIKPVLVALQESGAQINDVLELNHRPSAGPRM